MVGFIRGIKWFLGGDLEINNNSNPNNLLC